MNVAHPAVGPVAGAALRHNAVPEALGRWMDLARAAAAGLVAASHARDLLLVDYTGSLVALPLYLATGFGHSGVIVFFVISGFWITKSVCGKFDRPDFWSDYLIHRLTRLTIVLVPALLVGGTLDALGVWGLGLPIYGGDTGPHSLSRPVEGLLTFPNFVANLFYLQTLVAPTFGSNGPLWSLAFEFWYYLWFPALLLVVRSRRPSWLLLVFGVIALNPEIAWGFVSWLCGSLLYLCTRREQPLLSARKAALVVIGAGALFVLVMLVFRRGSLWSDPLLAASFALLLYGLWAARTRFPSILKPVAEFGANSSFSLYVIHFPLMLLLAGLITGSQRLAPSLTSLLLLGLMLGFAVAVAWGFSQATERHTDALRGFLSQRLRPAPLGDRP